MNSYKEYKASVIKKTILGGIMLGIALTIGGPVTSYYSAKKKHHIEQIVPKLHEISKLEKSVEQCEENLLFIKKNPILSGEYNPMQEKCKHIQTELYFLKSQPEILEAERAYKKYDLLTMAGILGLGGGPMLFLLSMEYLTRKDK
ncbi:MAG: hypothetical protein PHD81_04200 [Candidatus Nanoarchaeia archaeon]|nr:hypothetical protein [Candidatus Nanoarchaeia archaeon]MDD5588284.1 hypothetical protein [Candidatus Nanoarchaeia archaeon]